MNKESDKHIHHHHDHDCNHDHQEGCGHGCDHDHDHENSRTIHLTLEDNSTLECDVLGIFEVENKEYIALLPTGTEKALLYAFKETDEGPELTNIPTDEEYDLVGKAFMKIMEEGEEE